LNVTGSPSKERPGGGRAGGGPSPLRLIVVWTAIGILAGFVFLATGEFLMSRAGATPKPTSSPKATAGAAIPGGTGQGAACTTPSPGALGAGACPVKLTVVGLVTAIDAKSLVDVRSFTLRADDGHSVVFEFVPGVNTGFPPAHLEEHRASGEKVQVTYHVDAGRNLVDHLDDAPVPSLGPSASP